MADASLRHFLGVCLGILVFSSTAHLVGPLFPLYQTRFGLTHGDVGWIAALYGFALIPTMFLSGPWSDRFGRSSLLVPAIAIALLSDVVFAGARNVWWLVAGRIAQGVAVGAFFGPATALASDLMDERRPDAAALGAAIASITGAGIGPLISGSLLQANPRGLSWPFLSHLVLLGAAVTLLIPALRRERSVVHRASVTVSQATRDDPGARRLAFAAGFAGWSIGGLLFTMFPVILRPLFEQHWALLAGIALFGLGLAGSATQIITIRWLPKHCLAVGGPCQAFGLFLLVVGLSWRYPALWLAGALLTGLGLASVHRGGIGLSVRATSGARKGWAISRFLCCGFLGMNVPVIGFGFAADVVGLHTALLGYAAVFGTLLMSASLYGLVQLKRLP